MIKELVMVTMDAAEASSPVLEKETVMKLGIIISYCVSNGAKRVINK